MILSIYIVREFNIVVAEFSPVVSATISSSLRVPTKTKSCDAT
jgi:hypothetical protein